MLPNFFLIGYDGLTPDELFKILTDHDVNLLIDIRLRPNEAEIEQNFDDLSIRTGHHMFYYWMKVFANFFMDNENWGELYDAYLIGMDVQFEELYNLLIANRACIMSEDHDLEKSHRLMLADRIKAKYGLTYADLNVVEDITNKYGIKHME